MLPDRSTDTVAVAEAFHDRFPQAARVLERELRRTGCRYVVIPDAASVCVRDHAPVPIGRSRWVRFSGGSFTSVGEPCGIDSRKWFDALGIRENRLRTVPIVLSGSDLTGTFRRVTVLDSIDADQPGFAPERVRDMLLDALGVREAVVVRRDRSDRITRITDLIRCDDDRRVLVADLRDIDARFAREFERLVRLLRLDIVRLPPGPERSMSHPHRGEAVRSDCDPLVFESYCTFLRCGNTVFVPQFGTPSDTEAVVVLRRFFGAGNIVPLPSQDLAEAGASLHRVGLAFARDRNSGG